MYEITASIVTYKTKEKELLKAINSFLNTKLNVRLFISDNSPNNSLKKVIESLNNNKIEYIFNNNNGGYGWGHNIAIRKIINSSKYHLILNPDIYFEEGVLEELFKYMEKNTEIGNIMPQIKYPNNQIQYLCKMPPTPITIFLRTFCPIKFLLNKRNYKYEMRDTSYKKITDVEILSGCFMFIRGEVFSKIGLFDESFFMYFEDFDFNRRIRYKYKTIFYPKVEVIHEHAREAHKNKKMLYIAMKSAIKYFNKWGWW